MLGRADGLVRVRELLGFPPDRTIVAGDSGGPVLVPLRVCLPRHLVGERGMRCAVAAGNDILLFSGSEFGVMVAGPSRCASECMGARAGKSD